MSSDIFVYAYREEESKDETYTLDAFLHYVGGEGGETEDFSRNLIVIGSSRGGSGLSLYYYVELSCLYINCGSREELWVCIPFGSRWMGEAKRIILDSFSRHEALL